MTFKLIGSEPLEAVLNLRVSSREKKILQENARAASMSISELVRARYFGRPVIVQPANVIAKEIIRLRLQLESYKLQSSIRNSKNIRITVRLIRNYIEKLGKS